MTTMTRLRSKYEARMRDYQEATKKPAIEVWGRRLVVIVILVWAASFAIGYQSSLTILTLIGFFAAIVCWRSPAIALIGIAMLFALDSMTRVYLLTGGLLRWNTLNYWMLLVILLSVPFMLRLRDPQTRLLQAFVLLLTLELLISPRISTGIQDVISILAVFSLYVYFARVLSGGHPQEEQTFYWLGLVIGVLAAVGDLIFFINKDSLPYINPNAKAIFPLTALFSIVLAYPYARNYRRGRLTLLLLAAINALWIFLSGSRGNMLVGIFCLIFLFMLTRSVSWTTLFISLGLLLGFYISFNFLQQQLYARGRIERLFDTQYSLAERTSGRSDLALAGWYIFVDHPLGIGTGGFRAYAGQFEILEYHEKPAHSAWVKTLAENGFPGLILMAMYLASFAYVGLKKGAAMSNQDLAMIGLLVALALAGGFLSTEFQNKGLWFLAAGATAMMHKDEFSQNILIGGKLKKHNKWYLRKADQWKRNRSA